MLLQSLYGLCQSCHLELMSPITEQGQVHTSLCPSCLLSVAVFLTCTWPLKTHIHYMYVKGKNLTLHPKLVGWTYNDEKDLDLEVDEANVDEPKSNHDYLNYDGQSSNSNNIPCKKWNHSGNSMERETVYMWQYKHKATQLTMAASTLCMYVLGGVTL